MFCQFGNKGSSLTMSELHTQTPTYFEVTEEGGGVLEFPLDVEGDHPRTAGALSLHDVVLGVGGQACVERGET